MNILDAIADRNLFRPFLADAADDLGTWRNWQAVLRALYGLPLPPEDAPLARALTGRDPDRLAAEGFDAALFLTGRRSGKSRIAAVIAAYEAALGGHESKLAAGETGYVAVASPTRSQSRIVRDYVRAVFASTDLLAAEVAGEDKDGFTLTNGIRIEILTGDPRSVRGFTLVAAVVDEAAFFGLTEESKVRSDGELIRALRPSLATTGGRLIAISSPYARQGWRWKTYEANFGNDVGRTLVVNCPSRTLNPSLPESVVDAALAEDPAAARSEYLGQFRDDISAFLSRDVILAAVKAGRTGLIHRPGTRYVAFADLSGGRHDDAALAIAHKAGPVVVVDLLRRWKPPFNPQAVIGEMAALLRGYGLSAVTGDNYSAEFVASGFRQYGVRYAKSDKPKSPCTWNCCRG